MKITFHPSALTDLETIHAYIKRDDPDAARRVLAQLQLAIRLLGRLPNIGKKGKVDGTQELVVSRLPYIVVYRQLPLSIEIIAVFHTAQDRDQQ